MARSNLPSGLLYGKSSWILQKVLMQKLINTVQQMGTRIDLCIRGQSHPLTFNQCVSYFDNFKASRLFK